MVDKEKNILFQGSRVLVDDDELGNSLFFIPSTPEKYLEIRKILRSVETEWIESALLEVASIVVGFTLYMIGGRVRNDFELIDSISWLEIKNGSNQRGIGKLPSPCADPVIGVYNNFLYILPEVWKFGYHRVDEDKYLTGREGYIWNTKENKCLEIRIRPPKVEGEKWQWRRIRACAALDGRGLLIAMDGERKNFFLHNPVTKDWEICDFKDPLPKFIGETSFAESNGRLYILEVRGKPPAFLYIYDIKEGQIVMDKMPIPNFDDDLWLMDEWDRVVRIVPVADDKLCFLWLGPLSYENENMWPPVRFLHHLEIKFSIDPDPAVEVVGFNVFSTTITDLLYCLPCSESFSEKVKNNTRIIAVYFPRIELDDEIRTDKRRSEAFPKAQIKELKKELANMKRAHLERQKATCALIEQKKKDKEQYIYALLEEEGKKPVEKIKELKSELKAKGESDEHIGLPQGRLQKDTSVDPVQSKVSSGQPMKRRVEEEDLEQQYIDALIEEVGKKPVEKIKELKSELKAKGESDEHIGLPQGRLQKDTSVDPVQSKVSSGQPASLKAQIDELEQDLANLKRAHLEREKAMCALIEQRKKYVEREEEEEKQKQKKQQYIADLLKARGEEERGKFPRNWRNRH